MEWYYAKHGKQEGPVDLATLQGKFQSGELAPTDLVWREGMAEWTAVGSVAEVSAVPGAAAGEAAVASSAAPNPQAQSPMGGGYPPQGIAPNMAVAPTSGLAIASMVCGIVSLMLCYINGVAALPAVICGHMALKQINKALTPVGGRGMAIAGLVTGYIGLAIQLVFIVGIVVAVTQGM
ncbi:MAG: GYF domain-containing protein [Verrucomicrobia bacterium]|nr:GYF domain-containing protein [Verrucomicrobiota bacterium]